MRRADNGLMTHLMIGAATVALAVPATAQTSFDSQPGEIIVTAQKRNQSLLDVPIAITVLNSAELERNRVNSFADISVRVPNVAFSNLGDRSQTRISIRGVGPISTGGTANLVGVFIDEFNIAPNVSTRTSDPTLFDAAQIEVLKGPQGTFFGRNVVGGAISITTIKPDPKAIAGRASLTYSSFDSFDGRAALNLPLGETAAIRVNGHYDRSDGYLRNLGSFGKGNASENYGGRAAVRYQPDNTLTIDVQGSLAEQRSTLPSFVPTGFASSSLDLLNAFRGFVPGTPRFPIQPDGVFPANSRTLRTDIGLPSTNRIAIITGRVEAKLTDAITLTNVTGYIDNRYRSNGEGDFTNNPSFTVRRDEDLTAVSTETRLSGSSGRLNWLAGVLFARDTNRISQDSQHLASDPFLNVYNVAFSVLGGTVCPSTVTGLPINIPGPCPGFGRFRLGVDTTVGFFENVEFRSVTESFAAFGNLAFKLTDQLTIEAGGRYSSDRLTSSRIENPLIVGLAPRPSVAPRRISFQDFSPRVAAVFRPSRAFSLFAVASRGYRTGGFNLTPGDGPFQKESLWNYEGGVRVATLDGKFRASATVFHMDWDNTQVRAQDVITQRQVVLNAQGSKHTGFEIEATISPIRYIEVGAAYGYLNARFRNFANARDLDGNALNATGFPVPRAPENSISTYAQGAVPVTDGIRVFGRVEYQFKDKFKEDVSLNNRRLNPAYTLVNLRAGIESERYSLTAFVENVGNTVYRYGTSNLETYLSGAQASVGPSRRFGATLSANF